MIYCKIGSSCPTIIPDDMAYTPQSNEVLMSSERAAPSQVAKEDGTWVTPPSAYTVYECVGGKLTIDKNSTYNAISQDYESQYNTLAKGGYAAEMALKNGTITQTQYDTNISNLATQHTTLLNKIKLEQEVAING